MSLPKLTCVLVGDASVGKTCATQLYISNTKITEYIPTMFDTFSSKVIVDGKEYKVDIIDTGGSSEYDKLRILMYANANVVMIVFSVVHLASFEHVKSKWVPEITQHCKTAPFILVGNNIDQRDEFKARGERVISNEESVALANTMGAYKYIEMSTATQQGIKTAFEESIRAILDPKTSQQEKRPTQTTIANDNIPTIFKLLLIGDPSVGKSSLILRYADDTFVSSTIYTIGVDFKIRTIDIDGIPIKLQIWDTLGQAHFKTRVSGYYQGTKGVFIVYDITNRESFDNVKQHLAELEHNTSTHITTVLVGNKCDLEQERQVPYETAKEFANQFNLIFCETSARNSINVEQAFTQMAKNIKFSLPK